MTNTNDLFSSVCQYPDPDAGDRFDALVGLDETKTRLLTESRVLLSPQAVAAWSQRVYGGPVAAVQAMTERSPLIVFAGDVGTGKTELAESVGHPIAVTLRLDTLTLFSLSLAARGGGLVGQMTKLLGDAFTAVRDGTPRPPSRDGAPLKSASILLVDEADALAQSREATQMHHEDRAGVNALIRGVDELRRDRLPVLTILCTNRVGSLDPAVLRRAAHVFEFSRPRPAQIQSVLSAAFSDANIDQPTMGTLAALLGPTDSRPWPVTFSDLRQRFIPEAVLDAMERNEVLTPDRLLQLAADFAPTRPFDEQIHDGSSP
jgi:SpoVK/Ycf46/Vps4 family AAA+-type ATPase